MEKGQVMKRTLVALALAGAAGSVGGCGLFEDIRTVSSELSKDGRNQDDIATGAGLTLPPDMTLRPPSTSTSAASGEGTSRRAQVILKTSDPAGAPGRGTTDRAGREAGPTGGERELMTRSGVTPGTSDVVRRTVDIESNRRTSGQKDFTDRVLKYDPKAKPAQGDDKSTRDGTGDKPTIKRPGEL